MSEQIVVKHTADLKDAPEEFRAAVAQAGDLPRRQRALRRAGVRRAGHRAGADALRQVADLPRGDGGIRPSRSLRTRRGDGHPGEDGPGTGKRPLSIFEFPLQSWEEFFVIKLLADLAEILQVEDLLHCTFHPLRNLARMTMPEERFHAQFGEDFCTELVRRPTARRGAGRHRPLLPDAAGFLRRLGVAQQRDLPQMGHQAAHQRRDARGFRRTRATEVAAKYGLTLPEIREAA